MYDELYKAWKLEIENDELQKLPPEFYSKAADYMRRLREESRMLDKRTLKTNLIKKEMQNAKDIVHELTRTRFRKIVGKAARSKEISLDSLTIEEKKVYSTILSFAEAADSLAGEIVRGQLPRIKIETEHKRAVLRFLKDVPAIIGADMKTYGPFKVEDLASLPVENTKILIKQGLAEKVETN